MKRTCSIVICLFVLILFSGCLSKQDNRNDTEATEYLGIKLTPVSEQGNNAIKGTQFIDKDAYRLRIDGMVERPANLTHDQITTSGFKSRDPELRGGMEFYREVDRCPGENTF